LEPWNCFHQDGWMDLEVRRITPSEWRQCRDLRLEALQDSPLAFVEQYHELLDQPDEFWQARVERNSAGPTSSMFVAAVTGGQFVAQAGCFVDPDVTDHVSAHVGGVYVTPQARGEGVADALMAAVISWARHEALADRIRLFVTQTQGRAAAFYQRIGFVLTGATMPYPPNPDYLEHEMEYHDKD
jgi:GNAT superfamily N-acetyltransferase